jgi:uncharacterized protein YyaL (SSP411 family)
MTLDFLCRALVHDPAPETREMITTTLDAIAAGGIHDHLGGGFARYSTDEAWLVPHFEKMLYDNALLTRAYLHGYLVTRDERYRAVVEDIVGYVLRDLTDPAGGFYAAEDADSEGIEGKFYLWSLEELREVAGSDADEVVRYYGVTANGNFVDPHTQYRGNILHAVDRTEPPSEAVQRARAALFARRELRTRPGLDNKVLLGWNALFLAALTEAAAAFGRDEWMAAARTNAQFLLRELRGDDGRFRRSWRAPHLAYAEDYAALLEALLTLSELDDVAWLADARDVADDFLRLFEDDEGGGFFTTGHDAEALVVRPKDLFDDATPSANSLAANGLLRLAALTGDRRYEQPAIAILEMLAGPMTSHPTGFAYLLGALERHMRAPIEVVIVGERDDPRTKELRAEATGRLIPASVTLTADAAHTDIPLLADRPLRAEPTAYVCEHNACRQPVTTPEDLHAQLDAVLAARS